jgi:hypothetical protein
VKKRIEKLLTGSCKIDFGEKFFFSFSQNKSSCTNHPVRCEVLNKCFWSYNMETHYKAEHVHFFIFKIDAKRFDFKKGLTTTTTTSTKITR